MSQECIQIKDNGAREAFVYTHDTHVTYLYIYVYIHCNEMPLSASLLTGKTGNKMTGPEPLFALFLPVLGHSSSVHCDCPVTLSRYVQNVGVS